MKETLTFKICEMTVYDNYVVNVIKEGITVTPDLNDILLKVTVLLSSQRISSCKYN